MNWVDEYAAVRDNYENFSRRLYNLLKDILKVNHIKFSSIEYRAKSIESFSEKIKRNGKNYLNPLEEITDLCGIRIILFYSDDLQKVQSIIKKEFDVDEKNSIDKKASLNFDQFGYLSIHEIVKIKSNRSNLPEWERLINLKAEIQIRTVLQHAWASISHELNYKDENDIPNDLKRKLYLLSGLFELADEQFLEIKAKKQQYIDKINLLLTTNIYENVQIDMDSLSSYFLNSETIQLIFDIIEKTKFKAYPNKKNFNENTISTVRLSELIKICQMFNIHTLEQLNTILVNNSSHINDYFNLFVDTRNLKSRTDIYGPIEHIVMLLLVILFGTNENIEKIRDITFWQIDYTKIAVSLIKN